MIDRPYPAGSLSFTRYVRPLHAHEPRPDALRARFDILESVEGDDPPRFNIAPTDPVLAVREMEPGPGSWAGCAGAWSRAAGPSSKGARPLINARAETISTQPAFAESFRERRCLICADGFYEWLTDEQGKRPVWLSRPDEDLFAFAGVWAELRPPTATSVVHSCAIVTCEANAMMRPIHDRMPVILDRELEAAWLDADAPAG